MENYQEKAIAQIYENLAKQIEHVQLNTLRPPFVASSFSIWRKKAYNELIKLTDQMSAEAQQEHKMQFTKIVDSKLFSKFQQLMKKPYFDLVFYSNYGVPKELNVQTAKVEYHLYNELDMLAGSIAEWCIQIECAADLVDRAELYQFYKVNKKESEIYNNLILQLKAQQDQSVTGYIKSVIKKGITFGLKSFSEFVWTKGLALSNLSFGVLFLAYFSIIGASSFPIKMLLPDVHLGWLFGGLAGSLAINKFATKMEKDQLAMQLKEISDVFKDITQNLINFNQKCELKITECFACKNAAQLKLSIVALEETIKNLLECTSHIKQLKKSLQKINELTEIKLDDDWVILDKEQDEANKKIQQELEMEIQNLDFASDSEQIDQQQQQNLSQQQNPTEEVPEAGHLKQQQEEEEKKAQDFNQNL